MWHVQCVLQAFLHSSFNLTSRELCDLGHIPSFSGLLTCVSARSGALGHSWQPLNDELSALAENAGPGPERKHPNRVSIEKKFQLVNRMSGFPWIGKPRMGSFRSPEEGHLDLAWPGEARCLEAPPGLPYTGNSAFWKGWAGASMMPTLPHLRASTQWPPKRTRESRQESPQLPSCPQGLGLCQSVRAPFTACTHFPLGLDVGSPWPRCVQGWFPRRPHSSPGPALLLF